MRLSREGEVAVLRMEGGKANAMDRALVEALEARFAEALASDARAIVLTGYGSFFSAGLALPSLIDLDRPAMATFIDRFGEVMQLVFSSPRPVVAAMNGHAIAGGCVLALQADVRIATQGSARIGLNETALGIGLPSSVLEPVRLQLPASSIVPVALEGRLFDPDEALRVGLVDQVVSAEELLPRAIARAQELGRVPAAAFAQVKLGIRGPAVEATRRQGAVERERWLDTWFSPDARERLGAAVAKLAR